MKKDIHLVTFKIGKTTYGIEIFQVQEITKSIKITKTIKSRSGVLGIINLRNRVIPIIDLSLIINGVAIDIENPAVKFIIVESSDNNYVGFAVDEISKVINHNDVEISNPPESANALMEGIAQYSDQLIGILNVNNILQTLVYPMK